MAEDSVEVRELREADVEPALALLRAAGETIDPASVRTSLSLLLERAGEPCAAAVLIEEAGQDRLLVGGRACSASEGDAGDEELGRDLEALVDKALMKLAALRRRRLAIRIVGDPEHNPLARADFLKAVGRGEAA